MTLIELKETLKEQFIGISVGMFGGGLTIEYIEETDRMFGAASTMFGANIIRYSESNFEYWYHYHKILLCKLNILNLQDLKPDSPKLDTNQDFLSLAYMRQTDNADCAINDRHSFLELNFVANLFVFLHEAGHLNQSIPPEKESNQTNHFSEFNADYYAFCKILNYYFVLRIKDNKNYNSRVSPFGSEQNFMRCIIVTSLTVLYLNCFAKSNPSESETHPDVRKRFCSLLFFMQMQLENNFSFLFTKDTLLYFLVDIFQTIDFIEKFLFIQKEPIFDNLLNYCTSCFEEVKQSMERRDKFEKYNN